MPPTVPAQCRPRWSRVTLVSVAVAVLGLAAVLRCHRLGERSLWRDEFFSLECSAGWGRADLRVADSPVPAADLLGLAAPRPWADVWTSMARDENHPPLYFLALRTWRAAFGDSPAALRSLSVVASLLAVALTMAAGAEAFGPTAGLWAGLLMAVATPQLREAQDARAYMPVTAASAMALWAVVRIARRGTTRGTTAALFAALLVLPLLHYMALATVGAVVAYAAVGLRGPARRRVLGVAAVALAIDAVCWGPQFLGQHQRMLEATRWLADPAEGHVGRTLVGLLSAPVWLVVKPLPDQLPLAATVGLVVLVAPLLGAWAGRRRRSTDPRGRASMVLLVWTWLAMPVAVAAAIDLATGRHSLHLAKYTLAAAPGLYLLIAATAGRSLLAWVPAAAVVAAAVAFVPDVYHPDEPDWRQLARAVTDSTTPRDPVVLIGPAASTAGDDQANSYRVLSLLYYLGRQSTHRDLYVLNAPPTGPALAALRRARHACVVGSTEADPRLPGLAVSHWERVPGMAIVGTADRAPMAARPPALSRSGEWVLRN